METQVTIPFDGDFDALRVKLAAWGFDVGERPNAPIFARGNGVVIHAYHTGKLLLSGARAEEWARELRAEVKPRTGRTASPARTDAPAFEGAPGWVLYFDGSCMPRNPGGVAAFGFVIMKDGRIVHEGSGVAAPPGPGATNNVAEFRAIVEGLRWLGSRDAVAPLVRGDSELVMDTLTGKKTLRAPHLLPLRDEARRLIEALGARLEWVPRERNADADRMSRVGFADAVREHPEWAGRGSRGSSGRAFGRR